MIFNNKLKLLYDFYTYLFLTSNLFPFLELLHETKDSCTYSVDYL